MGRRRGRYLGVLRGSDEVARNKLINYFKGNIEPSYPEKQGPRDDTRNVWVLPYGLGTPPPTALMQQINGANGGLVQPFFSGYLFTTLQNPDNNLIVPGLLSDRANITINRSQQGTRKTSQLTGLEYKDYSGTTITVPFGRPLSFPYPTRDEVFQVIFNRVKTNNTRNLCSYVPANYGLA